MEVQNNLAQLRQKRGLSASQLASMIGVSRQTIYAMESGSYVPNTVVALKLADALSVKVEDIFNLEKEAAPLRSEDVELVSEDQLQVGQPLRLCYVDSHLMAASPEPGMWSLPLADAIVMDSGRTAKRTRVQVFEEDSTLDRRLLIAGCDPGISVLSRHLLREGVDLVVEHANSTRAMELLKAGSIHIAGTHIRDEQTRESNLPVVGKLFRANTVAVLSFALWEEGIVIAHGNPKNIRSVADFARPDVKIANREKGAGSRLLLDTYLHRIGISGSKVRGYDEIASGHLPAARRVKSGEADCCLATKAAARVFGLDFLPLVTERYDLVVRRQHLKLHQVQALFETLGRSAFRRELEGLGGYDASVAGSRVL